MDGDGAVADVEAVAAPAADARPTNEELKEAVRGIVAGVDVSSFSMKGLMTALTAKFPGLALSGTRKVFVKDYVVEVIQQAADGGVAAGPAPSAAEMEVLPPAADEAPAVSEPSPVEATATAVEEEQQAEEMAEAVPLVPAAAAAPEVVSLVPAAAAVEAITITETVVVVAAPPGDSVEDFFS